MLTVVLYSFEIPLKILASVIILHVSFFAVSFPYLHNKVILVL